MSLNKTSPNRLIHVPEKLVRGFGQNLVVKPTNHYCKYRSKGGLALPNGGDDHVEKKYDIGEIVAVGPSVMCDMAVGDIVIWQCTSAWRLPNGTDPTHLYHMSQTAVVALLPNPDRSINGDPAATEEIQKWHHRYSGSDLEEGKIEEMELDADARAQAEAFINTSYQD